MTFPEKSRQIPGCYAFRWPFQFLCGFQGVIYAKLWAVMWQMASTFLWFHKSRVDFDVCWRLLVRNWKILENKRRRNGERSDRWFFWSLVFISDVLFQILQKIMNFPFLAIALHHLLQFLRLEKGCTTSKRISTRKLILTDRLACFINKISIFLIENWLYITPAQSPLWSLQSPNSALNLKSNKSGVSILIWIPFGTSQKQ